MFLLVPSDKMTRQVLPSSQASSDTREHKMADSRASEEMSSLLDDISQEYQLHTSLTGHNEHHHQQQQQQWSQRHHDVNNASLLTSLSTDDLGWSADADNDSSQHSSSRHTWSLCVCATCLMHVYITCSNVNSDRHTCCKLRAH